MTTECITHFTLEDRKPVAAKNREHPIQAHEIGAAIIVGVGFVLLLPGAAVMMSLLNR